MDITPPHTLPPYKDKMGRWRTQSLFKEFYLNSEESLLPVFTLKEHDSVCLRTDRLLPSMRQLFLRYRDPTGYTFAKEVLGSYDHYLALLKTEWFPTHLEKWIDELEVKIKSESLKKIRDVAGGSSGQSFNAAKFLATESWIDKKGRPSKKEIERKLNEKVGLIEDVENDLARINS